MYLELNAYSGWGRILSSYMYIGSSLSGVGKDIEQMAQIRAERVGAASSSVVRREYRLGMSAPLTYTCVRENTYIPSSFGLGAINWGNHKRNSYSRDMLLRFTKFKNIYYQNVII